ncbi:aromatic ring-hydroxylating dioxygenase subunit alpha [Caballeronia sp. DA-9]|uniref:aromatic ring-hydroxylating dioxygenase subunit alpha n=1 Tax=Caballeronia sp. DA-9 TaxID=3436237 RepID=UPI003F66B289
MNSSVTFVRPATAGIARVRAQLADEHTPLIPNCWYVIGRSDEFTRELKERTILSHSIVFYRTQEGHPVALQNRCPHRSFPLSKGTLEGDTVRCGYHGLAFDTAGLCVDVPSQNVIPPSICIRAYPVAERGPFVWIWMGRPEHADEAAIPDTSWLASAEWSFAAAYLILKANYVGLHENLLDLTHFTYLHPTTLGTPEFARSPFDVEVTADRVRITRFVEECDVPPMYIQTGITGKMSRLTTSDFLTPALHHASAVLRNLTPGDGRNEFTVFISHFLTPETQNTTHYWFTFARDFAIDKEEVTEYITKSALHAFHEDVFALEQIRRLHAIEPDAGQYEINLKSDQPGVAARRALKRMAEAALL